MMRFLALALIISNLGGCAPLADSAATIPGPPVQETPPLNIRLLTHVDGPGEAFMEVFTRIGDAGLPPVKSRQRSPCVHDSTRTNGWVCRGQAYRGQFVRAVIGVSADLPEGRCSEERSVIQAEYYDVSTTVTVEGCEMYLPLLP